VQDVYDKTALELAKTKDMEINLKDDLERAHFDLEMVRERFDKASVNLGSFGFDSSFHLRILYKLVLDQLHGMPHKRKRTMYKIPSSTV
jgi:hypothetical protein